jgi:hypothetical protein
MGLTPTTTAWAARAETVTVSHFGFPHTAQVIQVTRKTHDLHASPGGGGP